MFISKWRNHCELSHSLCRNVTFKWNSFECMSTNTNKKWESELSQHSLKIIGIRISQYSASAEELTKSLLVAVWLKHKALETSIHSLFEVPSNQIEQMCFALSLKYLCRFVVECDDLPLLFCLPLSWGERKFSFYFETEFDLLLSTDFDSQTFCLLQLHSLR